MGRSDELAEHQVGELPEQISLGLGEFIERRHQQRQSRASQRRGRG
jgi:hypothetical protein